MVYRKVMTVRRAAAIVFVTALIAACAPAPAAQPPAPAAQPSDATSTPAPTAAPEAQATGGTLTIGMVEEPETLNPYITQLVTSFNVLSGVMEGLLDYDTEQKQQPRLAESYTVSDDGLTYTFKLRQGVKWHDGQPFTSADVKATWEIIMNPDFAAYSQLGWDQITALETPDDFTVVMTTGEKYAPFLTYVGGTPIAPKHEIDKGIDPFKQEFGRKPIGTGPFKVASWETAQAITLEANKDYWGNTPKLDKIVMKIVPDTNTLMVQLRTGEVQLTDAVPSIQYPEAQKLENSVVTLRDGTEWTHMDLKYIGFLTDKRVRQALDYATPKQQIVDQLLNGLATVGFGDQAPGTPWINPNLQSRPYDLEAAAKLLEEAGFTKNANGNLEKDGQPLIIEHWIPSGDEGTKRVQQVIAASWRKLGIQVDERDEDIKSIWGPNGYQFTDKLTAGQYSWTNGNDPDSMFYWHSSQIPADPTGTGGNLLAYFQKFDFQDEIDRLTEQAAAETNFEKRQQLYWQAQELLHEQAPVVFMYWGKRIYTAPKNLTGFKPNSFNYLLWDAQDWAFAN
jgi:peptide/nickel transport system substrate-binding protein